MLWWWLVVVSYSHCAEQTGVEIFPNKEMWQLQARPGQGQGSCRAGPAGKIIVSQSWERERERERGAEIVSVRVLVLPGPELSLSYIRALAVKTWTIEQSSQLDTNSCVQHWISDTDLIFSELFTNTSQQPWPCQESSSPRDASLHTKISRRARSIATLSLSSERARLT